MRISGEKNSRKPEKKVLRHFWVAKISGDVGRSSRGNWEGKSKIPQFFSFGEVEKWATALKNGRR